MKRRDFLRGATFLGLNAAMSQALPTMNAMAQVAGSSDYKALVCVFLFGGIDNHDVLIPTDAASYDNYSDIRQDLLSEYSNSGASRAREDLLELAPENSADFEGRRFGLPADFSNMHTLFQNGRASIISNIGPLLAPLNRQQFLDKTVPTPARLFSHNDQQSTWQSFSQEGSISGWGGLFGDAVGSANSRDAFTTISANGNSLFLTGQNTSPYPITSRGGARNSLLETLENDANTTELFNAVSNHFDSNNFQRTNLFERDFAEIQRRGIEDSKVYNNAFDNAPSLNTSFPPHNLGNQLKRIAQAISIQSSLGANRQIYYASLGGFDTHSNQAENLPSRMRQIDEAVQAFDTAMIEIGKGSNVTLFTASDFGRTLSVNGDGTDHGWGGTHFVTGGAVRGNRIFGHVPESVLDHDYDAGNGRLIPTTSVEQLASQLGNWFGLSENDLNTALPNRGAFNNNAFQLFQSET